MSVYAGTATSSFLLLRLYVKIAGTRCDFLHVPSSFFDVTRYSSYQMGIQYRSFYPFYAGSIRTR